VYKRQVPADMNRQIGCFTAALGRQKTAVLVRGEAGEKALHLLERPGFPQLTPGANTIQVVVAGGASWSNLEISCRNRWL